MRTIFPTFPRIAIAAASRGKSGAADGKDDRLGIGIHNLTFSYLQFHPITLAQILMRVLPPVESILGQPSTIHLFMWWGSMQTFVSTGLDLELVPTVQNNSVAIAASHCRKALYTVKHFKYILHYIAPLFILW